MLISLILMACLSFFTYCYYFKKEKIYQSHHVHPNYPKLVNINDDKIRQLALKGEYIAKISNCISCHTDTQNGQGPYAGGLAIDTPYGEFFSSNITPDKETGIGRFSENDFTRAMRLGLSPKGRHYFPVFPYIYFTNLNDNDLHALYTYLKHIPAIKSQNKSQPFPFNLPGSGLFITLWNKAYLKVGPYNPHTNQSPSLNRGAYLVEGSGHCGMCHTPLNFVGAPKQQYKLSGTFIGGYWAPNIAKAGLINTPEQDIINVFNKASLLHDAGPLAGPMANVSKNSLKYLNEYDQKAIAQYLKTVESTPTLKVTPSNEKPNLSRGAYVYQQTCSVCHHQGKMGAPRIGNGQSWYNRIQSEGVNVFYQRSIKGFNSMPKLGGCVNCSKNDIIAAVDYMLYQSLSRSQWKQAKKKNLIRSQ